MKAADLMKAATLARAWRELRTDRGRWNAAATINVDCHSDEWGWSDPVDLPPLKAVVDLAVAALDEKIASHEKRLAVLGVTDLEGWADAGGNEDEDETED